MRPKQITNLHGSSVCKCACYVPLHNGLSRSLSHPIEAKMGVNVNGEMQYLCPAVRTARLCIYDMYAILWFLVNMHVPASASHK